MLTQKARELAQAIRELKAAGERVFQLSQGLPAAELNSYMIQRQIEMLEIEILDVVGVLAERAEAVKE